MNARIVLVVFSYSLLATSLVFVWFVKNPTPESELYWQDEVRLEVQELVEDRYLEPLGSEVEEQLFDSAMRGYVRGLDPFSRYFDAAERSELEEDTRGEFGGIGVQVRINETGGVLITAVRIGGPAQAAGIEPGEIIEAVDGAPLTGLDLDEMVGQIKGKPDTAVGLTLRSPAGGQREVAVNRAMVDLDSVPLVHVFAGDLPVGYARIAGFSEHTGDEIAAAIDHVQERGARALVLDLRFNVGGVVSGAVGVANLFLPAETTVCWTRGRDVERPYVTSAVPDRETCELPIVVLVNGESASASEILAGALQDHGRAVLVGARTYGKFLVQTLYPLQTREALVRITTSRYETPLNRSAQRNAARRQRGGMVPDVRAPLMGELERDAVVREFSRQTDERIWRVLPAESGRTPHLDNQLEVALDLLRGGEPPPEPVLRSL